MTIFQVCNALMYISLTLVVCSALLWLMSKIVKGVIGIFKKK